MLEVKNRHMLSGLKCDIKKDVNPVMMSGCWYLAVVLVIVCLAQQI